MSVRIPCALLFSPCMAVARGHYVKKVIMSGGLFCQFNKKIFLFDNFKQ